NLCYNHLKSCSNFAKKYTTKELKKILQIDNESNYESSEKDTVKKIKQTESQNVAKPVKRKSQTSISQYLCRLLADDIQQQFERHLIHRIVVNGLPFKWIQDDDIVKEVNITKKQFELLAKDDNIDVSLERSCASNINSYTERYIEDLAIKNINIIGIVSDSAEENVKS
ncbi:23284_t:CDS:2, partial [Gigaspora margarita]